MVTPARQTQPQPERRRFGHLDPERYRAIPRIGCFLAQGDCASTYVQPRRTLDIEMDSDIRLVGSINVLSKRGEQTCNVGWATRYLKPFLTMMHSLTGKRISIEERFAIK